MNTTTVRSSLSLLIAAAIVAALPTPAEAIRTCPYKNCAGTDGDEPNGTSRTGLEIKRSPARAGNLAIKGAVLPDPVVSLRVCPYRNCGGAEDEPNGTSRTGSDLLDAIPYADSFDIGRVVLPRSVR